MDKLTKAFSADITIEEGERAVVARITTAAVDRDGEVLIPQGCNTKDFEKNPVVFLNHNYWDLPVGKCAAITRDEKGITAKTIFAKRPEDYPEGEEWMPDTLLSLFKQGIVKGFSVGFLAKESRPASEADIEKYGPSCRRVYTKWSLLEYSVAPLPANQEAVALAVSKTWKEKEEKDKEPLYGSKAPDAITVTMEGTGTIDGTYVATLQTQPKRIVHYRRKAAPAPDPTVIIARAIEKRKGFIYSRH
ncbi:MAG TPA: HK97 family phage prohead protease [Prosthecobacter sp.]|nr:HK97 family phage prohead protease [Prosthecobacter sp.]